MASLFYKWFSVCAAFCTQAEFIFQRASIYKCHFCFSLFLGTGNSYVPHTVRFTVSSGFVEIKFHAILLKAACALLGFTECRCFLKKKSFRGVVQYTFKAIFVVAGLTSTSEVFV